jgi:hypothetical protein
MSQQTMFNVHDINVQHITAPDGKGGFTNVKRVTFSVGDHGPFTKDYAPPNDTAANIKADISAQVAELQSINELAS